MDPQDPNMPKKPEIDHSNPFDQFFTDEPEAPVNEEPVPDIQATLNQLAPQVPVEQSEVAEPLPMPEDLTSTQPETPPPFQQEYVPQPEFTPETEPIQETSTADPDLPEGMALPDEPIPAPVAQVTTATIAQKDNFIPKAHVRVKGKRILVGLLLFVLMTIVGMMSVLLATGNINNDFLKPVVLQFQKLPFMPKSTEFVISQALAASNTVTSYHYDLSTSMNIASQQFGVTGDTQFDIEATGDALFLPDGSLDKVQGNATFRSGIPEFSGTLSANYVSADKMIYLQMSSVTGMLGTFTEFLPPVNTWYSLDTAALESQAREVLDATITPTMAAEPVYGYFEDVMTKLFESDQLEKEIKLEGVENLADNTPAYRLHITPSTDTLVGFMQAFGEYTGETFDAEDTAILRESLQDLTTVVMDIWVDEDNFMLRKFQLVISYAYNADEFLPALPIVFNPDGPLVAGVSKVLADSETQKDTIDISLVTEFTNVNQSPVITVPTDHTPIEEYYSELFNSFLETENTPTNNSMIMSDISLLGSVLEFYFTENSGVYPNSLSQLTTVENQYLTELPTAPENRSTTCTVQPLGQYGYVEAPNGEVAVWADLEPCGSLDAQSWYVYFTACGRAFEVVGSEITETDIATGRGC